MAKSSVKCKAWFPPPYFFSQFYFYKWHSQRSSFLKKKSHNPSWIFPFTKPTYLRASKVSGLKPSPTSAMFFLQIHQALGRCSGRLCHAKHHGSFRRGICLSKNKIKPPTEGLCTREVWLQDEVGAHNHCDFGPRGEASELVSFVHGGQVMTGTGSGSWLGMSNSNDLFEWKMENLGIQSNQRSSSNELTIKDNKGKTGKEETACKTLYRISETQWGFLCEGIFFLKTLNKNVSFSF